MQELAFFWHRRDLRLYDNTGLAAALASGRPVLPVFIFDRNILDPLPADDRRVSFLHREVERLAREYAAAGGQLIVRYGTPEQVWSDLLDEWPAARALYTNRDYEPYAKARDQALAARLAERGLAFHDFADHVLLESAAVRTDAGAVYKVFTPYKNRWLSVIQPRNLAERPSQERLAALHRPEGPPPAVPSLEAMGFREASDLEVPPTHVPDDLIARYTEGREQPAAEGTSRLGVHLRFGTISIRELARRAQALNATFLSELIWRDFYSQILDQYPQIVDRAFKPEYDRIGWRNDAAAQADFAAWCEGRTGYPLVDAGMRQLRQTGFMHNRVRMVVASFLTKHLLIDWRWGERWFAQWLLDFDLASNIGGWQWAAGTGVDAAPYFRVFNPSEQARKFDPDCRYIRRWVPEFEDLSYPRPLVEHRWARERALATYKAALGST